jgi:hypothetical protein
MYPPHVLSILAFVYIWVHARSAKKFLGSWSVLFLAIDTRCGETHGILSCQVNLLYSTRRINLMHVISPNSVRLINI